MSRPVRVALWTLPVVALLVVLGWLLLHSGGDDSSTGTGASPTATATTTSPAPTASSPDATAATAAPEAATPDDDSVDAAPTDPPTDSGAQDGSDAAVVVTSAGEVDGSAEVVGYAEVVEEDGTCTLTLTSGATTLTIAQSASPDAATTSCGLLRLTDTRLVPGSWTGVLAYDSATTHGVSTPFTIQIG